MQSVANSESDTICKQRARPRAAVKIFALTRDDFIVPAHALSIRFAENFREASAAFVATPTRLKA